MSAFTHKDTGIRHSAPEELKFIGAKRVEEPTIDVFDYTHENIEKVGFDHLHELEHLKTSETNSWINVDGLHEVEVINTICQLFELHPILVEDILNTTQRPKFEEYDNCFFVALKMLRCDDEGEIEVEHISLVVGKNYLLSFQEGLAGDVFDPIRERLSRPTTKIRTRKTDYLAYALMDIIIDNYISIIEGFGEKIEELEKSLTSGNPDSELLRKINEYKSEINFLRRTIRPVRELATLFEKSESDIIEDRTIPYLKSLVDHTIHATEAIETYQIMLNDQLHIYQTSISNKLNDILRVLTIFSVVFIPLTFLAGVYGTNFEYLPELHNKYAYPVFWVVMILTAAFMLYFFKRKKWL